SRRAELAAAAVRTEPDDDARDGDDQSTDVDGAERLAAAAAFFGRSGAGLPGDRSEADEQPAEQTFVVPALVSDDDDAGDPAFAPGAPAVVVEEPRPVPDE